MIKIESDNIHKAKSLFYEACEPFVRSRLIFIIRLLYRLKEGAKFKISDINSCNKLHHNTISALIRPLIKKDKKTSNITNSDFDLSNDNITSYLEFLEITLYNLEAILVGLPDNIKKYADKNEYALQQDGTIKVLLEKIFFYERLTGEGFILKDKLKFTSYTLTSLLGFSVCPYCNRNWIITVSKRNKKVTNPQLDHFFSKSHFPLLRLSFYNLIPSCETCNARLKKNTEFKIDNNLHPYLDGYSTNAKFIVHPLSYEAAVGVGNDYKVVIDCKKQLKSKVKSNHETFKIDEIYEKHGDIISEVFRKKYIWNDTYFKTLKTTFSELNISKNEMYRLIFGNYLDESEFSKRPFSKLTKDLTEDILKFK
ncbi:hypothetical protein [Tenacibaculum ovolyticum]|uniref:hypothetical protein n=1 Tax=Tenacibaculum ovolyticum TaxID=104270 RepID=UPI001F3F2D0C|nr:hypothetical protein [Tenacibaculum ovolyticum]